MLATYPAYTPQAGNSEQDCLDDVYDVIDEILYNLKYGGNDKVYDAALVYVTNVFEGNPVETFIDAERDEAAAVFAEAKNIACLLYTSPSPRDKRQSRMPSSA